MLSSSLKEIRNVENLRKAGNIKYILSVLIFLTFIHVSNTQQHWITNIRNLLVSCDEAVENRRDERKLFLLILNLRVTRNWYRPWKEKACCRWIYSICQHCTNLTLARYKIWSTWQEADPQLVSYIEMLHTQTRMINLWSKRQHVIFLYKFRTYVRSKYLRLRA
jgi:hypothetical protein